MHTYLFIIIEPYTVRRRTIILVWPLNVALITIAVMRMDLFID